MERIAYRAGYKYQLAETYGVKVSVFPNEEIGDEYLLLSREGSLIITKGYAWDGPSGPAFDTPSFMRASLVHDALYQLMRSGKLARSNRDKVDEEMYRLCLEDGMWSARAWWVLQGAKRFAGGAAGKGARKQVLHAP